MGIRSHEWMLLSLALFAGHIVRAQAGPSLSAVEALIEQEKFPEAESMLEALRTREAGTEVTYRLAYVQFRQRRLLLSRQNFTSIVRSAPPAFNSRYFLGRIALMENLPAEAIAWFEPVVESGKTIYDAASQLAAAYQSSGQPRRALAPLQAAIQQAPWDGSLYFRLGRIYQQLRQPELAREALATNTRLREASAADAQTLMAISNAAGQGSTSEAASLGRQISGRPDAAPATLVALGLLWVRFGLPAAATDAFERAAGRDPNYFTAQFNFGLSLLRSGRAAEAREPLTRAVALLPQSPEANLTLGLAAVMLQRYAEARPVLEAARRLDPANVRVATLLATACLRTGRASEALTILRASSSTAGDDPAGPLMLVEALNATAQPEAALEAARQAQLRFPKVAVAQMALAQQLARLGRYQESGPVFEQVLALEPGHPEASLGLGDVRQKAGDHAAAVEAYRVAIDFRATTLAARLGAARSLGSLKRYDEARRLLEDGLGNHAGELSLHLELSRIYARLGLADLAAREAQSVDQLKAAEAKR